MLANDINTPQTDCNLFKVADNEEKYFINHSPELYAVSPEGEHHVLMHKVSKNDINADYGRFRKLTPRECLRLMGFDDNFKIVVSDTETYKQAGNSIVVNVLMALLKQIDITKYGIDNRH